MAASWEGPFWAQDISLRSSRRASTLKPGKENSRARSGCSPPQGAEVEIDETTGQVTLLNLTAAHDVGKAINLQGCTGQIEGALGQGIGQSLFEEMVLEDGVVVNPTLMDYKIPCMLDLPNMVPMVVEEPHPEGPWGAKGVGEPGLAPTAPCIASAIYDALGIQIRAIPFRPERVLSTIENKNFE